MRESFRPLMERSSSAQPRSEPAAIWPALSALSSVRLGGCGRRRRSIADRLASECYLGGASACNRRGYGPLEVNKRLDAKRLGHHKKNSNIVAELLPQSIHQGIIESTIVVERLQRQRFLCAEVAPAAALASFPPSATTCSGTAPSRRLAPRGLSRVGQRGVRHEQRISPASI